MLSMGGSGLITCSLHCREGIYVMSVLEEKVIKVLKDSTFLLSLDELCEDFPMTNPDDLEVLLDGLEEDGMIRVEDSLVFLTVKGDKCGTQ